MARNSTSKSTTQSRIRFVMVEAELGDGDIGQITQAIQNALRSPVGSPIKRIAAITPPNDSRVGSEIEDEQDADTVEVEETAEQSLASTKTRNQRKPAPTPEIVDIDMNAEESLKSFAQGKDISSQKNRYLTAAAWLKEHRKIDAITAGHIYTCFRSMGWSTNIQDFAQPLRELKSKKYFGKSEKGYEINHIGLDYVRNLGGSNGVE